MIQARTTALPLSQPAVALRKRRPDLWYYPFSLYAAVYACTDALPVLFAATVLGANDFSMGLSDALQAAGSSVALVLAGRLADRSRSHTSLMANSLTAMAVSLLLLAVSPSVPLYLLLMGFFGFFMAVPLPVAQTLIAKTFGRGQREHQYVKFSRISGFGAALGLGAATVWLLVISPIIGEVAGMRALFLTGALVVMAASILVRRWAYEDPPLDFDRPRPHHLHGLWAHIISLWRKPLPAADPEDASPSRLWEQPVERLLAETLPPQKKPRVTTHAFSDSLKMFYIATVLLFTGVQLCITNVTLHWVERAGQGTFFIPVTFLTFLLSTALAYLFMHWVLPHFSHLTLFTAAGFARGVVFVLMGAGALFLPLHAEMAVFLVLTAATGFTWAATTASSIPRVYNLAPANRRGEAVGMYNGMSQLGMIAGAASAGVLASLLGPPIVFFVGACIVFVAAWLLLKL